MFAHEIEGNLVVLTEGPSSKHPEANHRMEIIDLDNQWKKSGVPLKMLTTLEQKNPLPGLCKSSPNSERRTQVFQQVLEH